LVIDKIITNFFFLSRQPDYSLVVNIWFDWGADLQEAPNYTTKSLQCQIFFQKNIYKIFSYFPEILFILPIVTAGLVWYNSRGTLPASPL